MGGITWCFDWHCKIKCIHLFSSFIVFVFWDVCFLVILFFLCFFVFFFCWPHCEACGIFPKLESNMHPLQCEQRLLTTGPPGKSLSNYSFLNLSKVLCSPSHRSDTDFIKVIIWYLLFWKLLRQVLLTVAVKNRRKTLIFSTHLWWNHLLINSSCFSCDF